MKPFLVYLLRCADGSYYCGQTDDLDARLLQHQRSDDGYVATRRPFTLAWQGEFETREGAIAFEQQVKGWSRAKKEALIAGDWELIQELAKGRQGTASVAPVRPELPAHSVRSESPARSVHHEPRAHSVHAEPRAHSGRPELVEGLAAPDTQASTSSAQSFDRLRANGVQSILAGPGPIQRRAMAKAITLLESTRAEHRARADALLTELLPYSGKSLRLGISGVPGVGKSTFIEALGLFLIARGHRVAVLAVDPSSSVSGGSILGDKTRMERLSMDERAYIRPSPSSGTLGGVAEKTREAMLVCEAAGYDIVIVETVGVGQSETAVAGMTDMYVLLQLPNAGDDLQAIKKGVMELADLVVINKADIDASAATRAQAQIASALRLLGLHHRPDHVAHDAQQWHAQVMQLSALRAEGLDRFWDLVVQFQSLQQAGGRFAAKRQQQALAWMWERIQAGLKHEFSEAPAVQAALPDTTARVLAGRLAPSTAARELLAKFFGALN